MSATNATTNYSLPLFIGTDKPAWLVDWNGAMTAIDAQMKVNATAILANETAISGLSTTVSAHTTSISTISGQITTLTTGLNTAQGNINTINSLIGNGTPTTTDQTIIGAINEINAKVGNLDDLTTPAVSLVAAINAITGGGGAVAASAVSYDNTTSGLTADDVQEAIDELAAAITPDWTLAGTQTGTSQAVSIPATAKEVLAIVTVSSGVTTSSYSARVIGNHNVHSGGYGTAAAGSLSSVKFDYTNNEVQLLAGFANGADTSTTSAISVYTK